LRIACLALSPVLLLVLACPARGEEIVASTGKLDEPALSIALDRGQPVLTTKSRVLALAKVKEIRFDAVESHETAPAKLILFNRDELRGRIGEAKDDAFELETDSLGTLPVALEKTAAVLLSVPEEREWRLRVRQLRWLDAPGFAGRPAGTVQLRESGSRNGWSVERISSEGIRVFSKNLSVTLPLEKVELLELDDLLGKNQPAPPVSPVGRVRVADGSVLTGTIVSLDTERLVLDHAALGKLSIARSELVSLALQGGDFDALSDLVPTTVQESFPSGFERDAKVYSWRRDRDVVSGGRLRLGGRTYEKGLGVHTCSSLEFAIGAGYKTFRATVGVDDSIRNLGKGSVVFRVLVNGEPAKELPEGLRKETGEAPTEIAVDVAGKKKLTLVADYGSFLHVLGRADWADAYLVK
jgi:hypothetical protein